ncbi:MAG: PEP-utilizing enzyme [Patescibacteria group bacterium]
MRDPFDSHGELFRWGPAPIRLYYVFDFVPPIYLRFPKVYPGESWPKTLFLGKGKEMVFINELSEIRAAGRSVFEKYMLPQHTRSSVYQWWLQELTELRSVQERIERVALEHFSASEFFTAWQEFHAKVEAFWPHVIIPELGNYGSLELLEELLTPSITDDTERTVAMEVLTAPEAPSFFQEEEIALSLAKDLREHQRAYFWLKNSYASVEVLPIEYFEERHKAPSHDVEERFRAQQEATRVRKRAIIQKYRFPKAVIDCAEAIVYGIEWQDARKKDVWIYLHAKELLLVEAARRLEIVKDDLLKFTAGEIGAMLGDGADTNLIQDRRAALGFFLERGSIVPLDAATSLHFWEVYAEEQVLGVVQEIRGTSVSRGRGVVRGRVRVLRDPTQSDSLHDGDVLVAPMTTPEYIFAMKRSCAIITDTGGLTSHAAIVSRELGIPCIVGTKIATKVLKDGDRVEVDAEKGIVRKV